MLFNMEEQKSHLLLDVGLLMHHTRFDFGMCAHLKSVEEAVISCNYSAHVRVTWHVEESVLNQIGVKVLI